MTWIMPVRRRFISTTALRQHWPSESFELLVLTLVCQPLSQLHILWLRSQGQEVSLHRAFGVLLIEESLVLTIGVTAVHAHHRGH